MGEKVQVAAKKPEVKRENPASKSRNADQSQSMSSPVDQILYLQRTIGNQAVQRLIKSGALQAKLKIGQPGDKYEQEADRVADTVMTMPHPRLQRQPENEEEEETVQTKPLADQITPLVQRQEEPPEEEEPVQAKFKDGESPAVTHSLESRINSLKGGGQPLDPATRSFFEPRFGRDFSQVRVHSDSADADVAKSINAKAFTVGNHVTMGAGEYQSKSQSGQRLLGHELTHIIQQNQVSNVIQRDLALRPTHPDAVLRALTEEEYEEAIQFNRHRFRNRAVFLIIEDLVGPVRNAEDIDRDFIDRVLSIQAKYGLTQDGKVGENITNFLIRELRAEGLGGIAGRVREDLHEHLIRVFRSRAVGALQRAAARVRRAGLTPPAGGRELTAYNVAFAGRTWATDQPRILTQINAAATRLQGIDIMVVQNAADLSRIANANDQAFIRPVLNRLPATNTPSFSTIVLFEDWINDRNLRTTRLIHEAFHGLSDLSSGGSVPTIEHGPHPLDNAFAFQFFVSEITRIHFNRAFVMTRI